MLTYPPPLYKTKITKFVKEIKLYHKNIFFLYQIEK